MKISTILYLSLGLLLFVSCKKKEPVACISASSATIRTDEVIEFTNCSENHRTSEWNFGDGGNTNITNPSHRFTESGLHTVKLRVITDKGITADITKAITVNDLRIKEITVFDSDIADASMNWEFSFNGSDLTSSSNIKSATNGSQRTFTFIDPETINEGAYSFFAERSTGGFPPFFPGTVGFDETWETNPFVEITAGETEIELSDALEGIVITLSFEEGF